uniref:F-box domain-containing protein n=1 Tax=Mycena chlorophos TaxID=658473 RepID=A0ABQ0MCV5_MYCCL|nr:predicted protein [Mycena chlorophos]
MNAQFELPNELWAEVFGYLPPTELTNVHLTSRRFYALSHPVFFRSLVLDPDHHAMLGNRDFIGVLERYTAPHIRKNVRELTVSFRFGRLTRTQRARGVSVPLKGPMLESLQCFKHLRVLQCAFRNAETVDMATLGFSALPFLDKLTLSGCSLVCPASPTAQRIRVGHFAYTGIPRMEHLLRERRSHPDTGNESDSGVFRSFLSFLDPHTLHTLTLIPSFDVSPGAWLALDHDLYETFTELRKVDVTVDGPFLAPVRNFVEALPNVRDLILHGAFRNVREPSFSGAVFHPEAEAARSTGSLRSYTGPAEYLPIFAAGAPALTRVEITSASCFCHIRGALTQIPTQHMTQLSLVLPLGHIHEWIDADEPIASRLGEEGRTVADFFAWFPKLERLALKVTDNAAACDDEDGDNLDAFDVQLDSQLAIDVRGALSTIVRSVGVGVGVVVHWDVAERTAAVLPDLAELLAELSS